MAEKGDFYIDYWGKWLNLGQGRNSDNQLSNAISAQILSIEPQDQHEPIHRVPVNRSSTIVRFFG